MPRTNRSSSSTSLVLLASLCMRCDTPKAGTAAPPSASSSSVAESAPEPSDGGPFGRETVPQVRRHKDPATCPKAGPITFDEPVIEAAIRRQLRKPVGPIARSELAKVKTLDVSQATRNDELDPCIFPYLIGLRGLYLAPGELDDLSPLRAASHLESLRVSATKVSDLGPLSDLRKLDRLDLGRTAVRDLKPLAGLVNLTELQIDDTDVADLSPLAGLDKLEVLLIKRTRVSDVSPLKGLRKLKHLYIEGSLVRDVSTLSGLPALKVHEGS